MPIKVEFCGRLVSSQLLGIWTERNNRVLKIWRDLGRRFCQLLRLKHLFWVSVSKESCNYMQSLIILSWNPFLYN